MDPINDDEILATVGAALTDASEQYHEWSNGYWIGEAPEYLINVFLVKHFSKLRTSRLSDGVRFSASLEEPRSNLMVRAGARKRGRPHSDLRGPGKADETVWESINEVEKPVLVFEVKKGVWTTAQIDADVRALEQFLLGAEAGSSIVAGVMVYYREWEDRAKEFQSQLDTHSRPMTDYAAHHAAQNGGRLSLTYMAQKPVANEPWIVGTFIVRRKTEHSVI